MPAAQNEQGEADGKKQRAADARVCSSLFWMIGVHCNSMAFPINIYIFILM
jgi:hypothetical protein